MILYGVKYQRSKRICDVGFLNSWLRRRLKAEDNNILQLYYNKINIQNSFKIIINNSRLSSHQKQNKILDCPEFALKYKPFFPNVSKQKPALNPNHISQTGIDSPESVPGTLSINKLPSKDDSFPRKCLLSLSRNCGRIWCTLVECKIHVLMTSTWVWVRAAAALQLSAQIQKKKKIAKVCVKREERRDKLYWQQLCW